MVTSSPESAVPDLGKLAVLAGVREFPTRVKCASLAWHTLKAAVAGGEGPVSTGVRNLEPWLAARRLTGHRPLTTGH